MNRPQVHRGFTLIELLVVIAIIGILASVVLASLNSARDKGSDAAAKGNLNYARAEAELFYSNTAPNYSYDGVCALSGTNIIGDSVFTASEAVKASYAVSDTANITTATGVCHDSSTGWVAAVPLFAGFAWCTDYTGVARQVALTAFDTDNDITCN